MGIFVGAPISVGYYIWKSLIPTMLGNFVGGGLFVGTAYWYLYITGESGVQISFNIGAMATAEGGAGPTTISGRDPADPKDDSNGEPREKATYPQSGGNGQLMSTFGRDMGDDSQCKALSLPLSRLEELTLPDARTYKERMDDCSDEKSPAPDERV